MNIALIPLISIPIIYIAIRVYGKLVAKWAGMDESRKTPAVEMEDGVDYVPTNPLVVFGHHFATIAGAGPIVGPVLAITYGYMPAWLWLLFGGIFIGAVHDFMGLFISMREKGRSMAEVVKGYLGSTGYFLFIAFTIMMLVLVTSAFLNLTAKSLTSVYKLEDLELKNDQTTLNTRVTIKGGTQTVTELAGMGVILADGPDIELHTRSGETRKIDLGSAKTMKDAAKIISRSPEIDAYVKGGVLVVEDDTQGKNFTSIKDLPGSNSAGKLGIAKTAEFKNVGGVIGGIATMSVIIITLFSPLLGFLIYRRKMKIWIAFAMASGIAILSIIIGLNYPVAFSEGTWKIILAIYVIFAAGLPVWIILQPRDFTNVQILYFGIILLTLGVLVGGIVGGKTLGGMGTDSMPAVDFRPENKLPLWPLLFITIACGAVSGFHVLVAGGTVSKQVSREGHSLGIGYGGMLLETLFAIIVMVAMASCLGRAEYSRLVVEQSNPILGFAVAAGTMINCAFPFIDLWMAVVFGILFVEGFAATTLDSAVRLNRYLFEEFWNIIFKGNAPKVLKNYWVNAGLAVGLMLLFAFTNTVNYLWGVFGSANQLLAGLALITITVWLISKGKRYIHTLIPAVFMIVTTIGALLYLMFGKFLKGDKPNYLLAATDVIMIVLSVVLVGIAVRVITRRLRERAAAAEKTE